MRWLGALGALLAVPAAAQTNCGELPKTFEGQAYAQSGDTLAGVGLKPHIGLWGLKAPRPGSGMAGMRSRAALDDMLGSAGHRLSCRMVRWDGACRALAQCTITAAWPAGSAPQPHDIGVRMVEDGWAYGFDLNLAPDWDKDAGEKIAHFEALARQARKGLWPEWLGEQPKP
ncbi:MAG TPA: hypothetical protein VFB13_11985 [Reyranella sp.]|jgi:endonuclease YncB( thermonuclease family)|nr:hypothetical protein [Reyranella sp.]